MVTINKRWLPEGAKKCKHESGAPCHLKTCNLNFHNFCALATGSCFWTNCQGALTEECCGLWARKRANDFLFTLYSVEYLALVIMSHPLLLPCFVRRKPEEIWFSIDFLNAGLIHQEPRLLSRSISYVDRFQWTSWKHFLASFSEPFERGFFIF